MTRKDAIEMLAHQDLQELRVEERTAILADWWSIDTDDPEYETLPDLVRAAIKRCELPDDPENSLYDPILHLALRRSFEGVTNAYLEHRLANSFGSVSVDGAAEVLHPCPCCGYCSLRERGGYEICRVCFWEDDGTTNPGQVSVPNQMTLGEARRNFQEIGAVNEVARRNVLPDGALRYVRKSLL